jgi:acyl-CoA reductase-like NAD-dependent aldehyde dehydrogenase
MSEARVYHNWIGGEWVASGSGETFENRNPADTRELIGYFQASTAADVDLAVQAASAAFRHWRLVPAPQRGEVLLRLGQVLQARKEEYARDMTREMGKPLKETRGDVQEAIDMAFFMAGEGRRLHGVTTPSEMPNKFQMSTRQPLGVCGLITPWNFPMAVPSWKILPALICGNTVVIKPAEDTPLTMLHLAEALHEAGLPPGVFNVVTGDGPTAGQPLVEHPGVRAISFTGSTQVGKLVNGLAAPQLKRVTLELGGKNPIIVMEDADLELALDGILWGAFGTTGQRCTATSRLIVHRAVAARLSGALVERARVLRLGNGLVPQTEIGPQINAQQVETTLRYLGTARDEGANFRCGGQRVSEGEMAHGYFVAPTILDRVAPTMTVAREEIFGPVLSIIEVDGFEAALEIANDVEYGLSASIYTRDVNRAFQAMRDLETGIVYINAPTIGAEIHLPFGGTKATGNGHREAGQAVLDFYSEWKSIYVDYSGQLQRAQIDNRE